MFCLGMLTLGVVLAQKRVADGPEWVVLERRAGRSRGVGGGFIDQENRNVVPNRVDTPALGALQAFPIFFEQQGFFAQRTNQNV
jgi:hypothetical protein